MRFEVTNVKAVELGYSVLCDELGDCRISLGEPSKELGDTAMKRVSFRSLGRAARTGTYPILAGNGQFSVQTKI
jgi:hypothetical protein